MSRSTAVSASVPNARSGFRVVTGLARKWRSAISSAASHQPSAASTQPRSSASVPRRSPALPSGPNGRGAGALMTQSTPPPPPAPPAGADGRAPGRDRAWVMEDEAAEPLAGSGRLRHDERLAADEVRALVEPDGEPEPGPAPRLLPRDVARPD